MRKTNGETSMIPRRYEITDEQWEQIKDMFPLSNRKTVEIKQSYDV